MSWPLLPFCGVKVKVMPTGDGERGGMLMLNGDIETSGGGGGRSSTLTADDEAMGGNKRAS